MSTTVSTPRKVATTATSGAPLAKGAHNPVDATASPLTMTLPAAAAGVEISVEKVDGSANVVTISGTIRGVSSSITLPTQFEGRTFLSEGAGSWRPTSDHRTAGSLAATFATKHRTALAGAGVARLDVMANPPTVAFVVESGASPLGASAATIPYNSSRVYCRGCTPADNATFSFRDNGSNGADAGGLWSVEFDYYGADFVFRFRSFDTTGGIYQIFADDVATTASPFTPTGITPSAGGVYRMRVTFPTAAYRRIRVSLVNAQYRGLEVGPSDSVTAAGAPAYKAFVFGDSFVGSALSVAQQEAFPELLSRSLGWEMFNLGQGGTGHIHDGPGARKAYNDPVRISTAVATGAQYGIIFGTVNDDANTGQSQVQTAAASVYSQIAALNPKLDLIVVGPPPQHTTVAASRITSRDAVKAAALAAPNVLAFIDPIAGTWQARDGRTGGDGQQWIVGTGWEGATTGLGNSDAFIGTDNVHPTRAGHEHLAARIRNAMFDILKGI